MPSTPIQSASCHFSYIPFLFFYDPIFSISVQFHCPLIPLVSPYFLSFPFLIVYSHFFSVSFLVCTIPFRRASNLFRFNSTPFCTIPFRYISDQVSAIPFRFRAFQFLFISAPFLIVSSQFHSLSSPVRSNLIYSLSLQHHSISARIITSPRFSFPFLITSCPVYSISNHLLAYHLCAYQILFISCLFDTIPYLFISCLLSSTPFPFNYIRCSSFPFLYFSVQFHFNSHLNMRIWIICPCNYFIPNHCLLHFMSFIIANICVPGICAIR